MPRLTLTAKKITTIKTDAVVVAVAAGAGGPTVLAPALPAELTAQVTDNATALGVTGAVDEVIRLPSGGHLIAPVLVLVGVGPADGPLAPERVRRAAGAATRELAGLPAVAVALPDDSAEHAVAAAEGAALGAYAFGTYRAQPTAPVRVVEVLTQWHRAAAAKAGVERAEILADAVHATRDLVNTSPLDLHPQAFAEAAKKAVRGTGVKVTVLDEKALAAGGYGGLVAVGQGSTRPPRLVKVVWSPSRPKGHLALVGKGITFDSGGLSLKPPKSMETMKSDMAGAAAVLHTVIAAARLELPVKVTGWLCLAENMPSGTAQRPSDVITIRGGTTVEVLNTDAEGRLVLADGLVAAVEEGPDAVVDIATLTGAQVVALGTRVSAVMGTDELRQAVAEAADQAGEQFWPMPLPQDLRESINSKVADLQNIGERSGGMLVAGLFLREFVGRTPWAHLDIAGPSFNEGTPFGYTPSGGTGVGVRTLLTLAERTGAPTA